MTCVILKQFTNPKACDAYWKKKLRLEGNVPWVLQKIESPPTHFGTLINFRFFSVVGL